MRSHFFTKNVHQYLGVIKTFQLFYNVKSKAKDKTKDRLGLNCLEWAKSHDLDRFSNRVNQIQFSNLHSRTVERRDWGGALAKILIDLTF